MTTNVPLFMTMRQVQAALGYSSRTSIYNLMRTDAAFPKPRRRGRNLIWRATAVENYLAALPEAEFSGLSATERQPRS